jgi:membrane-bound lytic murein transglycosylase D
MILLLQKKLTLFFLLLSIPSCYAFSQSEDVYFQAFFESLEKSHFSATVDYNKNVIKSFCESKLLQESVVLKKLSHTGIKFNDAREQALWMSGFCDKKQNALYAAYGKSNIPLFDSLLKENKLPSEFKFLPVTIAAFAENQYKKTGAGTYNIPLAWAVKFNMKVSVDFDERLNSLTAANAAIKILNEIYSKHQDFKQTLLEFTFGPFEKGDIKLVQEKEKFLKAYFMSAWFFESKGFSDFDKIIIKPAETIVHQLLSDINLLQKKVKYPFDEKLVLFYNPQFTTGKFKSTQNIQIPFHLYPSFLDWVNGSANNEVREVEKEKIIHHVKSGENLGLLARKYSVSIEEIVEWNKLKNHTIYIGQKLIIQTNR